MNMTVAEVAKKLGVGNEAVRQWIRKGLLKGELNCKNRYEIRYQDFEAFVSSHKRYGSIATANKEMNDDALRRLRNLEMRLISLDREINDIQHELTAARKNLRVILYGE